MMLIIACSMSCSFWLVGGWWLYRVLVAEGDNIRKAKKNAPPVGLDLRQKMAVCLSPQGFGRYAQHLGGFFHVQQMAWKVSTRIVFSFNIFAGYPADFFKLGKIKIRQGKQFFLFFFPIIR